MNSVLDHLVVAFRTLDAGRRWAEAVLGVTPSGGGVHGGPDTQFPSSRCSNLHRMNRTRSGAADIAGTALVRARQCSVQARLDHGPRRGRDRSPFLSGFVAERLAGFPVANGAPCEGTGHEIGGTALIEGSCNAEEAKKYYDWLVSPPGQAIGARANSLQSPANKAFKDEPRIPTLDGVTLVDDFLQRYGSSAERKRPIERLDRAANVAPKRVDAAHSGSNGTCSVA